MAEWVRDLLGWPAFQLVRVLPCHRMPPWSYLWLLPPAGDWAYRDERRAYRKEMGGRRG